MLEETGWNLLNVADSPMTSDACRARDNQTRLRCPWGGLCPAFMEQWSRLAFMWLLQPASRGRQALLGQIMGRGPDDLIGRLGLP